jgi:membrane-associated phospholipid phosphatase
MKRRWFVVLLSIVHVGVLPHGMSAQDTAQTATSSPPHSASDTNTTNQHIPHGTHLLTRRDAGPVIVMAATVAALLPADRAIAMAFQRPVLQSHTGLTSTANALSMVGGPGVIVFSVGTYALGLSTHSRSVAALGLHTGEAIVLGSAATALVKGIAGRARPFVNLTEPHNFKMGRGFANDRYASFPSGHATAAFAAATAISQEVQVSWPTAAKYVTPISYGVAVLVGASRLYQNEHWTSDVVAGAGVGTLAGIVVERYTRAVRHNRFGRLFLPAVILPHGDRTMVAWALPTH